MFPGQGSQYVGMGRDIALAFPELRIAFAAADRALRERGAAPAVSAVTFSPKTVETHLGRVYAKLGVASKRALRGRSFGDRDADDKDSRAGRSDTARRSQD